MSVQKYFQNLFLHPLINLKLLTINVRIFFNQIVSMNPNILVLEENMPKCPICLGYLKNPVMIILCSHIFCELCTTMWLQKKENCPLCRKKLDQITKIYLNSSKNV